MKTSSFRLEFDSLRMLIGKYSKAKALCKQPVGSDFQCPGFQSCPWLGDRRPAF